jgi:hypothetical protein
MASMHQQITDIESTTQQNCRSECHVALLDTAPKSMRVAVEVARLTLFEAERVQRGRKVSLVTSAATDRIVPARCLTGK